MLKKLTRVGNSLALVIDDPILEHLGLFDEEPVVHVAFDGRALLIRRAAGADRAEFTKALDEVNAKAADMLARLANC